MHPRVFLAAVTVVFSLPVSAVNWGFLQFSPTSHFTNQDWDLLRRAGQNALMRGADGDIEGWSNPATGAYGTIQPLDTTERDGATCRRTVIYNNAGGASGTSRFTFCKQEDGAWRVAP
jgi:surface antigen